MHADRNPKTNGQAEHSRFAYTIKEAAEKASVSRTTIYELMRSGELAWTVIRRCRRILEADLLALLEKNRRQAGGDR
jgi:excisionase family DNA binding protein